MAALTVQPIVLGSMCVLDKSCKKHNTFEGEFAVVSRYNPATDNDVETLTLLIFPMDEKEAALAASLWLKAHPDNSSVSESDRNRFMAITDRSSSELKNLSGPMLRGIHTNYVADLLKRKRVVRFNEDQREEIDLATQLVGETFNATLAIEDDGEQFIETHLVRIDAVEEHPEKVCFVFMRNGHERSMIMRANQAIKHLPSKTHLMEVHFLSPQALAILKLLPSSADAEDNVICCEEVIYLMDQLGFVTDKTNQGYMSDDDYEVHMKRVGGQAAVQFDNALSAYEASGLGGTLKVPEANVSVEELVEVLMPIRCLVPSDLARSKGVRPPPPGVLASVSEYPKAQAVKEGAKDHHAFQELLTTIVPWFTPANRLDATLRHEATCMRALDKWLDTADLKGEPMLIASALGSKTSSAAELTVWALEVDEFIKAKAAAEAPPARVNSQPSLESVAQVISHRIVHPDTTGTEGERRERNTLANHANALVSNPVLEGLLKELSDMASRGDIAKLFDTVNEPSLRDSPLFPLLNTGEELSKAVAGSVSGETLLRLNTVRGALERRIEVAFATHGDQLTQHTKAALRAMRMGKMSKTKIFHLLAGFRDNSSTPDSPLQFLVDLNDEAVSDALYVRALQAVGFVWVLCTPYDAANVHAFMIALSNFTARQRENGASWQALSKFHAVLLRKVDEENEKYVLNESKTFRSSPQTSWITAPSRHLQDLTASVAVSAAKKVATEAMKDVQQKLEAMKKAAPVQSKADKTKKLQEQFDKSKKDASDLRKKLESLKKEKGSSSAAGSAHTEKKETGEGKRKREAKALLEKHGSDAEGRPPCYFHHRDGPLKCKFDADTCKSGHHLGKADDA